MDDCCGPSGYDQKFGEGFSHDLARRYRRRGLDRAAGRMVGLIAEHGVEGASVLEIGGGVGALQLELLRRGAARATNLELVDSYEADAGRLAAEAGMTGRMSRHQVDLAVKPDAVEPHDIVVLHRVVCCYHDYELLLGAAAGRARRLLVYSHPSPNPAVHAKFRARNLVRRLQGNPFRTFLHDADAMVDAASRGPLKLSYRHRGPIWYVVGLTAEPHA